MLQSNLTQCLHHVDLLGGVIPDGIGVVEPAVVGVSLFAVSQWEALVCGLRKLLTILHRDQLEVIAILLTSILLLTSLECSALHTVSEKSDGKMRWPILSPVIFQ